VIVRRLQVKDNEKHGEEIYYWPKLSSQTEPLPKLSIEWNQGKMQGVVKSWYQSGVQESSREMSHNVKQGLLTAWYKDGKLMMIEEYENDRLKEATTSKKARPNPSHKLLMARALQHSLTQMALSPAASPTTKASPSTKTFNLQFRYNERELS
jgi:hypothetical protein